MSTRALATAFLVLSVALSGCNLLGSRFEQVPSGGGPTADFTFTVEGLTVHVNASPSKGEGIHVWAWLWGDGSLVTFGEKQTHTFAAPGRYDIKLTVTDSSTRFGSKNIVVPVGVPDDKPVTPVVTTPILTPPNDFEGCDASGAKAAHRTLTSNIVPPRLTFTYEGKQEGVSVRQAMAVDQPAKQLYIRDALTGIEYFVKGEEFAIRGGDVDGILRLAGTSPMDELLQDLVSGTAQGQNEPFEIPTSWFTVTCETFRNAPAIHFVYKEHGLTEEWWFDPATSVVMSASHVDTARGTDLRATISPTPNIPSFPTGLVRLPVSIEARELARKAFDDGSAEVVIALAHGTQPVRYSELQLDLYDASGRFVETIGLTGATRFGKAGSVSVEDVGLPAIADTGDVWEITLSSSAATFKPYDSWADADAIFTYAGTEPAKLDAPGKTAFAAPARGNATLSRSFAWTFDGLSWTWDLEIPQTLYDHYATNAFTPTTEQGHAWDVYVTTPHDDVYIQELADLLMQSARDKRWGPEKTLSFALAFVQGLKQSSDSTTTGIDDYVRYPVETLVDGGGDAEDTAILYAALITAMGYDAVLFDHGKHVAAGVAVGQAFTGKGFLHEGTLYAYAETSVAGHHLGDILREWAASTPTIVTLEKRAILALDWGLGSEDYDGYVQFVVNATNTGTADVANVVVWMGAHTGNDQYHDAVECRYAAVKPEETVSCTGWLAFPPADKDVQFVFVAAGEPSVYVETATDWIYAETPTPGVSLLANAGPDRFGTTADVLVFDGSASTATGDTIASYVWDFGDGTRASGERVTHQYARPGNYSVKLTITGSLGGTASDVAIVAIQASTQVLDGTYEYYGDTSYDAITFYTDGSLYYEIAYYDGSSLRGIGTYDLAAGTLTMDIGVTMPLKYISSTQLSINDATYTRV